MSTLIILARQAKFMETRKIYFFRVSIIITGTDITYNLN